MIFVDTSAWYAAAVTGDANHSAAAAYLQAIPSDRLVTSDFVLDETLTLFKVRGAYELGLAIGERIMLGEVCRFLRITDEDFTAAFAIFKQYRDKGWSFTDCTSFVLMHRLGIQEAFAFDVHFQQFGTVKVLPAQS